MLTTLRLLFSKPILLNNITDPKEIGNDVIQSLLVLIGMVDNYKYLMIR